MKRSETLKSGRSSTPPPPLISPKGIVDSEDEMSDTATIELPRVDYKALYEEYAASLAHVLDNQFGESNRKHRVYLCPDLLCRVPHFLQEVTADNGDILRSGWDTKYLHFEKGVAFFHSVCKNKACSAVGKRKAILVTLKDTNFMDFVQKEF